MRKETTKALNELRKKRSELDKLIQDAAKKLFAEASEDLFDKHPTLESFGWTQYTPYFNDGDTCTFSANNSEPAINGEDDWDYTYGRDKYYDGKINTKYDPNKKKLYDDVQEMTSNFHDDDLLMMFGDHCKVTVNRSGVTIDDYEHD
jgi:hypothetical protein